MTYLFNDTSIAARRLQVLADVFAASSRTFLCDALSETGKKPQTVIDLGCGPGYTTHLLADVTRCERAIGLDSSNHFIELAERTANDRVSFALHDITEVPFPIGSGDLISCRYLLTHLQNPHDIVASWATQLPSGGLLLMEEAEWIQTGNTLFRTYLNIVAAMLEQQENRLYVGPLLSRLRGGETLRLRMSRVYTLYVPTARAATMFHMNIQSWKDQPFIRERYASGVIEHLQKDLYTLAETSAAEYEIEWGLRQMVFERI